MYFKKIISEGRKPNKIWADQGGEFYNNLFKRFLKINNIEMYSTYNEGKSVVAERFIRTLKNKIFKHMTTISKNVYFDVLDDIYNNTFHKSIKMKPNKYYVKWKGYNSLGELLTLKLIFPNMQQKLKKVWGKY